MSTPAQGTARIDAPWDISFLRPGLLVTATATAAGTLVAGLVGGTGSAVGVLAGGVTVAAFFCVSAVVIARAGRVDDAFALPAAVGTFGVKAVLFFAALSAIPADGPVDQRAMAWTVVLGALLWSAVQVRWVWTRQLYYVPPPFPPAGSQAPHPDPEGPTFRA